MIRSAKFADYYGIVKMIQQFALESPCEFHHKQITDIRRVQNTLSRIQSNGVILVSESDSDLTGVIMGQITEDLLFPEVKTLREVIWWVRPEHRSGTTGARLLKKYTETGLDLVNRGVIQAIGMTTLVNSPELKLQRQGWRPIETNYIFGGK